MDKSVYEKFAGALQRVHAVKAAEARRAEVYAKVAEAIGARRMEKSAAGLGGAMSRLAVALSPRVKDPRILKWLKPFIKTKTVRTGIKGTPDGVAKILQKAYQDAGMPAVGASSSAMSGWSSVGAAGNIAEAIANGAPYKTVTKNRLSVGRLAGAVGGAGAVGAGAYGIARGSKPDIPTSQPSQPSQRDPFMLVIQRLMSNPQTRNALIGAGIGGLGTAALSDGGIGERLLKGLAGAVVAGGATYAAPHVLGAIPQLRRRDGGSL